VIVRCRRKIQGGGEFVEVSSQIGPVLRGLRVEAGLTQEQLAEQAGLGVRTVQRLEAGKSTDVRLGTVKLVAHALADTGGRDREEVWQELLTAHHDQGSADEARALASTEIAPEIHHPSAGPVPPSLRPDRRAESVLAEVADTLSRDVYSRWIREEEQRRIHDPFPLPVRWRSAPAGLLDHWDNISGAPAGAKTVPLSLDGGLADIVDVYRRVPSGRLVVLGRAGSGKSVLMVRFVLDYLDSRAAGDPVPVVFSLGSWDPTTTLLRDWLVERLLRDYPHLAARPPGRCRSLAAALVDAGWVLPVLDGFDEIAAGLHQAALRELNAVSLPLVLTSRPEQFAEATTTDLVRKAAGIELADLTTADLVHYLARSARPTEVSARPDRAATVWDPVLRELSDRPDSPSSIKLTTALRSPLMVMLARTLYSDTPGQDPAVLLDGGRFPTPHSLEEHLLAGFVPTVYQQRPPARPEAAVPRAPRTWDPQRARRYLGHLAAHLDRPGQRNRQDLAWWQLSNLLGLPARILAIVLACTMVTALAELVQVVGLFDPTDQPGPGIALLHGPALGSVVGLCFGLAYGIAVTVGKVVFEPSLVGLQLPGRGRRVGGVPARRIRTAFGTGMLVGGMVGAAIGVIARPLGFTDQVTAAGAPIVPSPVEAAAFDVFFYALAAGLAFGFLAALEAPLDLRSAATPVDLLAANRTTVLRQAFVVGPVLSIAITIMWRIAGDWLVGASPPLWECLQAGCVCGFIATLSCLLAFTTWGHWVLFVRIWLPLTGRLPWATMAFLDDAYRKGVLRQVGAVYQFRHDRLQHHLSPSPRRGK
jgi:transcriptional regulator with XRE-family HTH domain